MQLHYTRLEDGHYQFHVAWCDETGHMARFDPPRPTERSEMIKTFFSCMVLNGVGKTEIYIDGAAQPHIMDPRTVRTIVSGERHAADLTFGNSLYTPYVRMREAAGQWFVLRPMPGQEDMYECPGCGRGAHLEGSLHCDKCGRTFVTTAKYWGVSVDLLDSLEVHQDQERYFIDRPWNDHPPWMSREELVEALKPYTEAVQAYTEY